MVTSTTGGEVLRPQTASPATSSVEASRGVAVHRVFRGAVAAVAGGVLTAAASLVTASSGLPFALGMASFILGGLGLLEIGRAAPHFFRYGTRGGQVGVVATAGLGAATVLAGTSNWIGVTFGGEPWNVLIHWSMNGVYTFGVIVGLSVLRLLVLRVLDSDRD